VLPNNLSSFFIEFLENRGYTIGADPILMGESQRVSTPEETIQASQLMPKVAHKFDMKNIKIAQRESLMWGTLQQEAIAFGNLVHEIMAKIRTPSDIDWALEHSVEAGVITTIQSQAIRKTLLQIVTHEELTDFFSPDGKVYNEQTIVQPQKGILLKPDRVVIKGNQAYLLDYKTGEHHEIYKLQLGGYEKALQEMGLQVAKKTLVYIGENIEIVHLHEPIT
jgi:ATP-dependent exoDNAse (exonuclease V) beta subunit